MSDKICSSRAWQSAGYTSQISCSSHDKSALLRRRDLLVARRTRRADRRGHHLRRQDARTPRASYSAQGGPFLVVPKKYNAQISGDGRYLLLLQHGSRPSRISLVDLKENRYVGEIETGGCSLAFPTGPSSVALTLPRRFLRPHHPSMPTVPSLGRARRAVLPIPRPTRCSSTPRSSRPSNKAFFVSYEGLGLPGNPGTASPTVGERWEAPGRGRRSLAARRLAERRLPRAHQPPVRSDARGWNLDPQAGRPARSGSSMPPSGQRVQRVPLEHPVALPDRQPPTISRCCSR